MLSFEVVVLVIPGIVVGAELVNVFMLGKSAGSVSSVLAPVAKKRNHQARSCSEQPATAEGHGPFATAAGR